MTRQDFLLLLIILLPNLFLRLYRLDFVEGQPIFDERAYYLEAARSYLQNMDDPNIEHPPLGKELIALGIKTFGDNAYGWRLPSLVFSLMGIIFTYLLAKELLGGFLAPSLASILVSIDNMYFIHSRLAILEMFLVVFLLGSLLFLWRYYQYNRKADLLLLSLSFGLGLATKWTTLLIFPVILVFLFLRSKSAKAVFIDLVPILGIASIVYILSYLPFIQRHNFWGFLVHQRMIIGFWINFGRNDQWQLVGYLLNHAFAWIFNPAWDYDLRVVDGRVGVIRGMFNPVVFWVSIFLIVKSLIEWRKSKSPALLLLLMTILLNFFPWLLVKRTQYLYYLLFSLPLMCILVTTHLVRMLHGSQEAQSRSICFLGTAILVFIYFYPMLTSWPVGKAYFSPLTFGPIVLEDKKDGTSITLR